MQLLCVETLDIPIIGAGQTQQCKSTRCRCTFNDTERAFGTISDLLV